MDQQKGPGLYLFTKPSQEGNVFKEMLQFLKTISKGKNQSFSYIEAETSLHPNLTLGENLELEVGLSGWEELTTVLNPEQKALLNLITDPSRKTFEAQKWEKFIISHLKGVLSPSQNLLIDMNEQLLTPFLSKALKESVMEGTKGKRVFLATANSAFWLDCAHTLVKRKEFDFQLETLDPQEIKKHWAS